MKDRLAAFAVPVFSAIVLLYHVFASLQVAILQDVALVVIAIALAIAASAGVLAAFGGRIIRTVIMAVCAVLLVDATFKLPAVLARLAPLSRDPALRDRQRIADLHRLAEALNQYAARVGSLPTPREYGEEAGQVTFWDGWWDISSHDGDGDMTPFLDFLIDSGYVQEVPLDPLNVSPDISDPRAGSQYVYFVAPADYDYEGGSCVADKGEWVYLLAVTNLETEEARPPSGMAGSGCECLWRDRPNFFQAHFDFVLCGTFRR